MGSVTDGLRQPLLDLTDDELREVVLSDWLQLTAVLSHELSSRLLSRLLRLELEHGPDARLTFVERLRGALVRARGRESQDAATSVAASLVRWQIPDHVDLIAIGLEEYDIAKLQTALKKVGLS